NPQNTAANQTSKTAEIKNTEINSTEIQTTNKTTTESSSKAAAIDPLSTNADTNSPFGNNTQADGNAALLTHLGDSGNIDEMTNYVTPMTASDSTRVAYSQLQHTLDTDTAMNDPFGLGKRPVLAVVLLFLAGLLLAFSACVYPMIPIVTNIVARQHKPTAFKGFLLTLAYGVGVATSYGLLGAVVAFFGRSLGIIGWMQNPWVLLGFGGVFVLLALYMLGVVHFRLPARISSLLHRASSSADGRLGSVSGSFLVGLVSALVVSPCVSAPLGGALVAVASIGNVALGFVALFALGLGLSAPLIVLGAAQGRLTPKSGDWMDGVRHFGGFLLLGVAIMLMNRVFFNSIMLMVWAGWFVLFALWLWQWRLLVLRAVAVLMGIWAVLLMLGASVGSHDVLQPLAKFTENTKNTAARPDIHVTSLQQLDEVLMRKPKVLAYVTADWCVECRIMQKTLFANRPAELNDYQLVKVDITDTTDDSRAVLERYNLFGAPAFLYYKDGVLSIKQIGEVGRDDFVLTLSSL
ncbi:MAG: cytochrome c biogenesis protein CcdA, partial [Moraxella sp.]|nr:cytochrome c biogenesis protein CcdA [Moraxella sp.]